MPQAVTVVASGGLPVVQAAALTSLAEPMTVVASGGNACGGLAVTVVTDLGKPVVLLNENGTLWTP